MPDVRLVFEPSMPTRSSVRVTPRAGTTACVGTLLAMYLDLGLRRIGLGAGARPLIAALTTVAGGIDARSTRMREPAPGELYPNFHIMAGMPR